MATRNDVVNLALAQLGQAEPHGDDKYIFWFNQHSGAGFSLSGTAWCSIFVCWVFANAGAAMFPMTAGCTTARKWWQESGRWMDKASYTPRPGDAIYFDWDLSGDCDHVGIVEKVDGDLVYTIEGNSDAKVAERQYSLYDVRIAGYGLPEFEEEDTNMNEYGGAPQWLIDEGAAKWLTEQEIFKGDEDGNMRWNDTITRAECGALIYRLAKKLGAAV